MTTTVEQQFLDNSFLLAALELEYYQPMKGEFLENCGKGSKLKPQSLMEYLVNKAVEYCGISKGSRTVCYDLAWTVLSFYTQLWSVSDQEDGFASLTDHLEQYYPEQAVILDDYDVAVLDLHDYFSIGIQMLRDGEIENEHKGAFCYALHLMLLHYSERDHKKEFDEFIEALKESASE